MIKGNLKLERLFKTEIDIMSKIVHPNVIHLHEVLESSNNIYLIVDYCNKGDFEQYLKKRKLKYLEEKEAVFVFKQIMNGFRELRKHKVIHRDFKMANIFVHDDLVKIGDFGQAKLGYDIAQTIVGSFMTMAPELIMINGDNNIQNYSSKADLWSVGFVFYQILLGDVPFFGLSPNEIYKDIKKKSGNLKFPRKISSTACDLINKLLQMDPDRRIDWAEFFNHPFFDIQYPKSLREFMNDDLREQMATIDYISGKTPTPNIEKEFHQNKMTLIQGEPEPLLEKSEEKPIAVETRNIVVENLNEKEMES